MKKTFFIILLLFTAAVICSCSPARKPETRERTFVVPEVSRVTFDTVDLDKSPRVVRNIAKEIEDRDATTWAQSGGKAYLIVSQGDKTKNYDMEVDEVLQRLPEQGFTWLDVKIDYSKRKTARTGEGPLITVVRADTASPPDGVGFTITGLEVPGNTTARTPARTAPAPAQPPAQQAQPGAAIESPAPNQQITSPVKITGTARAPGQIRVRISTRGGQILKEESLNPAPGTGAFSLEVTYSPPDLPAPGEIAVISPAGGDERVLARVPVIIK